MWRVSSRSGVATFVNCYTLVTYLLVCDAVWLLSVAVVAVVGAEQRQRSRDARRLRQHGRLLVRDRHLHGRAVVRVPLHADERPAAASVRLLRQYDSSVALSARCV